MLKKLFRFLIFFLFFSILLVLFSDLYITAKSESFLFSEVKTVPSVKTAVVLGTSKTLQNGYTNLYYQYRIEAVHELFINKKISAIIVSGDNSVPHYNEPEQMKNDLVKLGIPANKIYEDFAGFRTLDSVVRAKEIFGQNEIIFVSQKFHNERAIFIAQQYGIKAYGYNAQDVNQYYSLKTQIREYFARVKALLDILVGVEPKFGGKKVDIL